MMIYIFVGNVSYPLNVHIRSDILDTFIKIVIIIIIIIIITIHSDMPEK